MLINLGYKYRLKVSKSQKQLLLNHIFAHNQAWNILLNESNKQFEANKLLIEQQLSPIYLSATEQDNLVKRVLRDRNLKFNTKIVQQTRVNFNKDLKKTIKSLKSPQVGMLKFKQSKNFNNQSIETTKEQYKILDLNDKWKILRLFNESFKIRWTRDFPLNSEVSSLTISFKDNHFYVSFFTSNELLVKKSIPNDTIKVGLDINMNTIDLGNKDFHKVFKIKDIKLNNLIIKNQKKIKRLQRKQARRIIVAKATQSEQALLVRTQSEQTKFVRKKTKLGKNFNKTQAKINKIHTKNHNIKVFALHRLVNQILTFIKDNNINHIIMENLDVKQMTRKDNVNKVIGKNRSKSMKKSILHISFHMFKQIMRYKCAMNGVYLSLIDPRNTSKSCSKCGNIDNQLNIKKRIYKCKHCGLTLDRDYNACLNIQLRANKQSL